MRVTARPRAEGAPAIRHRWAAVDSIAGDGGRSRTIGRDRGLSLIVQSLRVYEIPMEYLHRGVLFASLAAGGRLAISFRMLKR
jgi:hypothetical protein